MISTSKLLIFSTVLLLSFSLRISTHGAHLINHLASAPTATIVGGYQDINVDKLTDDQKSVDTFIRTQ
jgi:hypothetical protein